MHYIENTQKEKLYYHFTPTGMISNFTPLIVIFHNKEQTELEDFEYKMWSTLQVIYPKSEETPSTKALLEKLIENIAEDAEIEKYIYMYGDKEEPYELTQTLDRLEKMAY